MALEELENGTLADADVVNGNFTYLDERITDTVSKIYANNSNFESRLTNLQTYLTSLIDSNITTVNGRIDDVESDIDAVDERVDDITENPYAKPTLVPLIDWDNMAFKANVADVRIINNTTTGIKAYGGDYGLLHSGDIYLTEDFTNYPRIMVVWTDDGGTVLHSTIWETWELDWVLSQSKGWTSLFKCQYSTYYWGVYGYEYKLTISSIEYKTAKNYFFTNGLQNCGIVEIYGLQE